MADYIETKVNKGDSLYALRKAMSHGSGKKNIEDLPVYRAPHALYSYLASNSASGYPAYLYLDKNHSVINSHELGHAIDHSHPLNRALAVAGRALGPTTEPMTTLASESAANLYSWNAIRNAYKDDPKLLNDFAKLRYDLLTPAYSTYMYGGANDLLVNNFGPDVGYFVGDSMGLRDRLINQGKSLKNTVNSLDMQLRMARLNRQIINHAKRHNYYSDAKNA